MTTNEDRREIAARLRDMADSRYYDTKNTLVLAIVLLAVAGVDASSGTAEDIMRRIADLIEPEERTCRVDMRVPSNPFCSNCGKDWDDDWFYCPRCGAKVVDD